MTFEELHAVLVAKGWGIVEGYGNLAYSPPGALYNVRENQMKKLLELDWEDLPLYLASAALTHDLLRFVGNDDEYKPWHETVIVPAIRIIHDTRRVYEPATEQGLAGVL